MVKNVVGLVVFCLVVGCAPAPFMPAREERCEYPRTAQMFSGNLPGTVANVGTLNRLAATHDVVVLNIDAPGYRLADGRTPNEVLRGQGVQVLAYTPAGYWWREPLGNQPHRNALMRLLKADNLLTDAAGRVVEPWPGQALLNHGNPMTAATMLAYLEHAITAADWDGIHWDVADSTLGYVGGNVDMDRNGVNDRAEHGLAWIDAKWRGGLSALFSGFDLLQQGNGSWGLGTHSDLSPFAGILDGALVEDGPATRYRDAATGAWLPAGPESLLWHLRQAAAWPGSLYAFSPDDLTTDDYWGQYVRTEPEAARLALGLALLSGSYVQFINPSSAVWCDECGVRNGVTSILRGAGDWLGCPLAEFRTAGNVASREFEHGVVYLNTRSTSAQIQPPAGFSTIRGWYDTRYNAGGPWDGVLGPYGVRVLWRPAQPAGPTPTPTARPTATPTVGERVRALETRVAELERRR